MKSIAALTSATRNTLTWSPYAPVKGGLIASMDSMQWLLEKEESNGTSFLRLSHRSVENFPLSPWEVDEVGHFIPYTLKETSNISSAWTLLHELYAAASESAQRTVKEIE